MLFYSCFFFFSSVLVYLFILYFSMFILQIPHRNLEHKVESKNSNCEDLLNLMSKNFSISKKSTSMHNLSTDMVSRIEYDEKEQECLAKDEQIQVNFIFIKNKISFIFLNKRFYKRKFVVLNIYFI